MWILLPDALMPDHIRRKERGAWGEQRTARQLKPLKREGWTIRHDLQGRYGNRDHVAVGPAVFLIDTKTLEDEVTIEGGALRVRRIDNEQDTYLADRMIPVARIAARKLEGRNLRRCWLSSRCVPGDRVWGKFDTEAQFVGNVAVVRADLLRGWLRNRKRDLYRDQPAKVSAYVMSLPRFSS
jgi:hypothetical protein